MQNNSGGEQKETLAREEIIELMQKELGKDINIQALLRQNTIKGFTWGAGAALLAFLFYPTIKEQLRPSLVKIVEGALEVMDEGQKMMDNARGQFRENSKQFTGAASQKQSS